MTETSDRLRCLKYYLRLKSRGLFGACKMRDEAIVMFKISIILSVLMRS